jgi:hypothetical protein
VAQHRIEGRQRQVRIGEVGCHQGRGRKLEGRQAFLGHVPAFIRRVDARHGKAAPRQRDQVAAIAVTDLGGAARCREMPQRNLQGRAAVVAPAGFMVAVTLVPESRDAIHAAL